MEAGAFDLVEPLPRLEEPYLVMSLRPWVDVGSAGTMAFGHLEELWDTQDLGRLRRPSDFYDLTRYRPMLYRPEGARKVVLPNTHLRYLNRHARPDLVLAHALEPHVAGQTYVESLGQVMDALGVQQFALVGGMYGPVPHTRPLLASGGSSDAGLQDALSRLGVRSSSYEGPTSVLSMATEEATARGIQALTLLVQVPSYAQMEENHLAQHALLRLLQDLYGLDLDLADVEAKGQEQRRQLDQLVQSDARLKHAVKRLEASYDASGSTDQDQPPRLSPEVERFLRDVQGPGQGSE